MFAAVSQNPVWIHSLRSINPMMRWAKPGSPATDCQLPLPAFQQGFGQPDQ
jgi:hypothetical protein